MLLRYVEAEDYPPVDTAVVDPGYWSSHIREPVRFAAAIENLAETGSRICIEIGPSATLLTMAGAISLNATTSRCWDRYATVKNASTTFLPSTGSQRFASLCVNGLITARRACARR